MSSLRAALSARLDSGQMGSYRRVADRYMVRGLEAVVLVSVCVALLEIGAIALMVPLIELLSGGELVDARLPGRIVAHFVGDWRSQHQTLAVLGVVIALLVIKVVAAAAVRWWTISLVAGGAATATTNLFAAYLRAPLSFHAHRNSAAAARTAAVSLTTVYNAGLLGIATVFVESCTVICIGLLLLVASPLAAIVAVVYFALAIAFFTRVVQRRTKDVAHEHDERFLRVLALLQQGLGGLREIRLRGDERARVAELHEASATSQLLTRKLIVHGEYGRYYIEGMFFVGFGVIATVQILTQGEAAFAALGMMLAAGIRLLPSAGRLLHGVAMMRQGNGSLSIITDELDAMDVERLDDVPWDVATSAPLAARGGPVSVTLRDLSYRYPGAAGDAVHRLDLTIAPGESLGIVGSSGSGKSTTVDVICGLLPPTAGELLIDGRPLGGQGPRPRIAYVTQDVFLIEGSVADNVRFGHEPVDADAMRRAVELAQLDRWIATLPDGIDTPVGERGALVSGGQRQRIGIARALYQYPSLLILDEATAALDVELEAELTEAISGLGRSITLVVIAHRLSTVRGCDRILVLEQGRAVGLSTYDGLSKEHEMFARWVQLGDTSTAVTA